jgi:hypothetical protein
MGQRLVMGLVAIVAIVAVGGIGFAAFTTSAYINASAGAGTLGPLFWSNLGTPSGTESFDQCSDLTTTTHNVSDTFDFNASNLAPGDGCTFTGDLNNGGSIPANVYSKSVSDVGYGCDVTYTLDNFGYESYGLTNGPITIGAHSYLAYTVTESLQSGIGNSYEGEYCHISIDFTATAGS